MRETETINDRLAAMAADDTQSPWLTVQTRREQAAYSRAGVLARSNGFAAELASRGLEPGGLVLIALGSGLDSIAAFIGALLIGARPAFIAPLTAKQKPAVHWRQLAQTCAASRPEILLVESDQWAETKAQLGPEIGFAVIDAGAVTGDDALKGGGAAAVTDHRPDPDETAFLQFSSGTTGLRKAVPLSHRMVLAQAAAAQSALGLTRGDKVVSWLPLYHDMGLIACFVMPLLLGVPLVLLDPLEWTQRPFTLFQAIEDHRGTHVYLPNFAFNHLALTVPPDARADLSSMTAFINCSEPCKARSFDLFLERFGPLGVEAAMLQTCYAMAEAVFAVTYSAPGKPVTRLAGTALGQQADGPALDRALLSVGRVLPGFSLEILDPAGQALADGLVGEIAIEGPSVFAGYSSGQGCPEPRPESHPETGRQTAWHRTGDLGFLWRQQLYVVGRQKDVVIVNGRNFFAHDLEELVNRTTGVAPGRSVAFGVHNEGTGSEDLVVLAEHRGTPSATPAPAEIEAIAKRVKAALLDEFGLNPRVTILPPMALIKTTSGKISRSENSKRYLAGRRAMQGVPAA